MSANQQRQQLQNKLYQDYLANQAALSGKNNADLYKKNLQGYQQSAKNIGSMSDADLQNLYNTKVLGKSSAAPMPQPVPPGAANNMPSQQQIQRAMAAAQAGDPRAQQALQELRLSRKGSGSTLPTSMMDQARSVINQMPNNRSVASFPRAVMPQANQPQIDNQQITQLLSLLFGGR